MKPIAGFEALRTKYLNGANVTVVKEALGILGETVGPVRAPGMESLNEDERTALRDYRCPREGEPASDRVPVMKITAIRSYMQRVDDRPRLLVKIETDEGISGWGEVYNHGPVWALPPILDYMFNYLVGEDPRRVEYLALKLNQQCRFPPGALGLAAISVIDHALWDIAGKAAGLPVYMLLGGNVRDRVKVYCRVYTAPDPEHALDQTPVLNEKYGYTAFKLSPYRRDLHNSRWGVLIKETGD